MPSKPKTTIPDFVVNSDYSEELFIAHVKKLREEHGYIRFKMSAELPATKKQRSALHVYCGLLAEALNDAGYDLRRFFELRPKIDIPWSLDLVKKELWKPIYLVQHNKESTTDANRTDYNDTYETLNRFTAQEFGISIPWPSKDNML